MITEQQITAAADFIRNKTNGFQPEVGLILGSGIGVIADEVEDAFGIDYEEIPGFVTSTVAGHHGRIVMGTLEGKKVLVLKGRIHYYEGNLIGVTTLPVRVMSRLGINRLIITNAAGAINRNFNVGDLMLIEDHINMGHTNPLIGPNMDSFGPRFLDTTQVYSSSLRQLAKEVGNAIGLSLQEGVYQFHTGPTYETLAEVEMARRTGADVVGMSTFPEAIAAAHSGMEVLGISYVSNMAAGISGDVLDHSEVIENIELVKDRFIELLKGIVRKM